MTHRILPAILAAILLAGCSGGASSGGSSDDDRAVFAPFIEPDSDVCDGDVNGVLCVYHNTLYSMSLTDCDEVFPPEIRRTHPDTRDTYRECRQHTSWAERQITRIRRIDSLFEAMDAMDAIGTFRGVTSRDELFDATTEYFAATYSGPSGSRLALESDIQCINYQRIARDIELEYGMVGAFRPAFRDATIEASTISRLMCANR